MARLSIGIDLVQVSRIESSITEFGERFLDRVFTAGELAYARHKPESLAARFAAKEAAKKALSLDGIGWRDVEVIRTTTGACTLALHGEAARLAGSAELAVSLSHEADFATAVVVAQVST
ncbi:MAG TPA: holo-ACP synthase [Kofleriaceae bacterium]